MLKRKLKCLTFEKILFIRKVQWKFEFYFRSTKIENSIPQRIINKNYAYGKINKKKNPPESLSVCPLRGKYP